MYHRLGGGADLNPHYNQNYTREEVDAILAKIKSCVEKGHYVISQNENRQENIDFINEYNIRSDKQRSILMQIKTEDFCHSLQNTKIRFEHEVLYVFVPQVQLFNSDGEEVKTLPEDHELTAAAWFNKGKIYEPVIAVKKKE